MLRKIWIVLGAVALISVSLLFPHTIEQEQELIPSPFSAEMPST